MASGPSMGDFGAPAKTDVVRCQGRQLTSLKAVFPGGGSFVGLGKTAFHGTVISVAGFDRNPRLPALLPISESDTTPASEIDSELCCARLSEDVMANLDRILTQTYEVKPFDLGFAG